MIETYKIVTGKYETCIAPSLSRERTYVTRGNDLRLRKFRVKYDLRKYNFLSEWSIYGIVCLTGLFLLTPLTHWKRDWINSGTIKIGLLFMISEHSYREPEVGVKFCMINFSKLVYCKVFLWCGHIGFKPAVVNSVYDYVYM